MDGNAKCPADRYWLLTAMTFWIVDFMSDLLGNVSSELADLIQFMVINDR